MAAVTPSSLIIENAGSCTLYVANFANTTDSGDIWTSGIKSIVSVMACQADASGTQTAIGSGAAVTTASTGAITIYTSENDSAITLWVLAKS